ncbi:hypothetical protein GIB67_019224 [Kingdonia uniflora]|uniref:Aminotransferase-like plant mobile domain-containing protein n=1 Tax=Kingdonia uniflora TaxID=39325 RepID=A0A7J7MZU6_9MAGN|nr:hypothetical protein GIB67_019224 [Kingdonia uniflora]
MTEPVMKRDLSPIIPKARVGFKCRSVLVKLCKIYVILIEVPHLKQRLKATNLMSVFDYKIGNVDNQVILAMIERWCPTTHTFHLPCGELGITSRDFTVLTGIGVLFENSKSWARLKLLCPIVVLENKAYTIDFGSTILGHLYYCLDQTLKQEVKYISGLFQLIEYHCYEYCQIGHHILIDNRLDDFWPRMSVWQIKRRKVTRNKAKHHLALMSRKRVLLQCPFGGYEWYLGDRCWAQLEHRTVPYNPPEKLHCFSSSDVVRSLRAAGWIEIQHYIVGHHVDYDAYWRHVSHGALMSDIARCGNINISGLGALTSGVTFPHVEFPTADFSTQETQIPPPRLGDYPGWIMELSSPHGTTWHTILFIASTSTIDVPTGYDFFAMTEGMRKLTLDRILDLEARHLHDESRITHLIANLRRAEGRLSQLNDYSDGEGIVVDWEDDEGEARTS